MKSILITGCNRGLGLGLIKCLVKDTNSPKNIIATCRKKSNAQVSHKWTYLLEPFRFLVKIYIIIINNHTTISMRHLDCQFTVRVTCRYFSLNSRYCWLLLRNTRGWSHALARNLIRLIAGFSIVYEPSGPFHY